MKTITMDYEEYQNERHELLKQLEEKAMQISQFRDALRAPLEIHIDEDHVAKNFTGAKDELARKVCDVVNDTIKWCG